MLETVLEIFPLVFIVGLFTVILMFIRGNMFGRGGMGSSNLIVALAVILVWFAIFPTFLDVMDLKFNNEPDCVQEDWVDCDIYNIPRDECEKDITEEGPYYDVRTITTFTKFTCVEWEDGSMLEARFLDEG